MLNGRKMLVFLLAAGLIMATTGCTPLSIGGETSPVPGEDPDGELAGGSETEGEQASDPEPGSDWVEIVTYMPNAAGLWLERQTTSVVDEGQTADLALALLAWMRDADFLPAVDATVDADAGTAVVSFSEEITTMDLEYEGLVLLSLVNTLTEVDGVDRVRVLIEGEEAHTLAGSSYIGEDLERDEYLIAREGFRPLAPSDPRRGERFTEGEVTGVDAAAGSIRFSPFEGASAGQTVQLTADAVIHRQISLEEQVEITIEDIDEGEIVGIILTKAGLARGIIVTD